MEWSKQQRAALDAVRAWLDGRDRGTDPRQCFYLAGFAGSGKTTLAREFALGTGLQVVFGAYTGKAALVLQKKGCPEARTIHSLIYVPVTKSKRALLDLTEEFEQTPEEDTQRRAELQLAIEDEQRRLKAPAFSKNEEGSDLHNQDLVVIDECSMVDGQMGEDLLSFKKPVLVLGDPAQLPPVGKGTGFFTAREPDFMLTEVHRQAAGSPVLKMATTVRSGGTLDLGDYGGGSQVLPKKGLSIEEAMAFDQIICGKNETRRAINKAVRAHLGRGAGLLPVPGDKLICLRNDKESKLLNGSFWIVLSSHEEEDGDTLRLALRDPDDSEAPALVVMAHRHHFEGRDLPWFKAREAQEFDYGYAITCHKSQGSQWNNVLIYDQSACFRQDRRKWLYTALTRAAEAVTIVRM